MDDLLDQLLDSSSEEEEKQAAGIAIENKKLEPLLEEINLITDQNIRFFVRSVLMKAESFWYIPSDFTDEHPPDELREGGNVTHTKRVTRIVKLICESEIRDEIDTDLMIAAALIHDLTKGMEWGGTVAYDPMHAYTLDDFVKTCIKEDEQNIDDLTHSSSLFLDDMLIGRILRMARCHKGFMSPIPETYPVTTTDWILHWANVIASNLHYVVDGEVYDLRRWLIDESDISEEDIPDSKRDTDSEGINLS